MIRRVAGPSGGTGGNINLFDTKDQPFLGKLSNKYTVTERDFRSKLGVQQGYWPDDVLEEIAQPHEPKGLCQNRS